MHVIVLAVDLLAAQKRALADEPDLAIQRLGDAVLRVHVELDPLEPGGAGSFDRCADQTLTHALPAKLGQHAHAEIADVRMHGQQRAAHVTPAHEAAVDLGDELRIAELQVVFDERPAFVERKALDESHEAPLAKHDVTDIAELRDVVEGDGADAEGRRRHFFGASVRSMPGDAGPPARVATWRSESTLKPHSLERRPL